MVKIGQRIARAARQSGLHADGNNVVINDGKAAFQSVSHIHLHVLPRRDGDKLSFAKGMLLRRDPDREESGSYSGKRWRSWTPLSKTDAMDISRWVEQRVGAPLLMLHDKIYKQTNGRIGHTIPGGPSNLILHTTGAKTGQKRANSSLRPGR